MRASIPVLLGGLVAAAVLALPVAYKSRTDTRYRNFRVVEDGVLYRSGQLEPSAFRRVVREYDIKAVVTFRDDRKGTGGWPDRDEEEYCQAAGIAHLRLTAKRWGSAGGGEPPAEANVRAFLRFIDENRPRGPILIHCFAGIHRTGAFAAVYRIEYNGWRPADAVAEMQELGYTTLEDDPDILAYMTGYVPRRDRGQAPDPTPKPGPAAPSGGQ